MNKAQKVIRLARESDIEKQREARTLRLAALRWRQKAEPHAMRKVWHP
jgi:hypothetical protein